MTIAEKISLIIATFVILILIVYLLTKIETLKDKIKKLKQVEEVSRLISKGLFMSSKAIAEKHSQEIEQLHKYYKEEAFKKEANPVFDQGEVLQKHLLIAECNIEFSTDLKPYYSYLVKDLKHLDKMPVRLTEMEIAAQLEVAE